MWTIKAREHTPSSGEIALRQVIGLRHEDVGVEEILRPDDAVLVEDEGVSRPDMLEEEIGILVRERVGGLGASRVVAREDRFGGQAVGGAELELGEIQLRICVRREAERCRLNI